MIKSAVITGPTGAVGCALIQELLEMGTRVYAVCRPNSKRISNLPAHELLQIIQCDVSDLKNRRNIFPETAECFFHLAWMNTFGEQRDNMESQVENICYTLDAVDLAKQLHCNTFVGAGSQAEYGRFTGELNGAVPTFPENGYGMAKLCAGQMSRVVCRKEGIRHIWTRILSVYGPFDGEKTMVMSTVAKLMKGEHVSFTQAEQEWDYLYSADAAKMLVALAEHGQDSKIYCLGSGKTRKLKEYIECIRDNIDCNALLGIGDIPYNENQVMYLRADIANVVTDTGYTPSTTFEEGIKKTIKWYKGYTKNEKD